MKFIITILLLIQLPTCVKASNTYLESASYVLGYSFYENLSFSTMSTEDNADDEVNKNLEYDYDPEMNDEIEDDNESTYYATVTVTQSSSLLTSLSLLQTTSSNAAHSPANTYMTTFLWNTEQVAADLQSSTHSFSTVVSQYTNASLKLSQYNNVSLNYTASGSALANLTADLKSEIQHKSVFGWVTGIGEFVCGFFVVCSIVDTAVNLGIDINDAVTGKEKVLKQYIKNSTRLVQIR